jgi:hypothetical protein
MHAGLYVKCLLFSNFNQNLDLSTAFCKTIQYGLKYRENPFSGSRVVTRGQTFGAANRSIFATFLLEGAKHDSELSNMHLSSLFCS